MSAWAKQLIRRALAARGYTVRWVGFQSSVTGVHLWEDLRLLVGSRSGAVVFDVGANVGQSLETIRETFDQPRIWSFEPSPETFKILAARHGQTPQVQLEAMALGEATGTVPFRVMQRSESQDTSITDSLLESREYGTGTIVQVPLMTIDAYCQQHGIARIDVLKVDAQGYDLNVLKGAQGMLAEHRIGSFCVEVLASEQYAGQPAFKDFMAFADTVGYRLNGVYDACYGHNRLHHFDACFVAP